jgi:hypothetical protein
MIGKGAEGRNGAGSEPETTINNPYIADAATSGHQTRHAVEES